MLLNDFFTINKITEITDNEIIANILLNAKHKIFDGHFPNNPVVPGVVSMQMINEILANHLKVNLMTSKAKSIKFTSMINPIKNPNLNFKIKFSEFENEMSTVNAVISFDDITFLKFKGHLKII